MGVPYTYKTHFLIGRDSGGASHVIARWEYVPTGPEIQAVIKDVTLLFNAFVLTNVIGDELPGNHAMNAAPDYGYCG